MSIKAWGTRNWGTEQAESYQLRLFEIFELVRSHPEIGALHEEYGSGIRTFPVAHHIVVYEIDEPFVTVLAIVPPHANVAQELS
jgi:plasmid stabilization system protein ParE